MERNFDTLYIRNERAGYQVGDDAAHRAAAALADRADAPTIIALTDLLTMNELIGGQFYVTAVRDKVDRYGNRVPDGDGNFETIGLVFNFETRDVRVEPAQAPETVLGLPVTDSHAPATQVAVEQPDLSHDPAVIEAAWQVLTQAGVLPDLEAPVESPEEQPDDEEPLPEEKGESEDTEVEEEQPVAAE